MPSDYYSESAAKQRSKKVKKFEEEISKKNLKKNTPKNLKAKKKKDHTIKKIINLQDTSKSNATKLMQMPCSSKNQKLLKYSQ